MILASSQQSFWVQLGPNSKHVEILLIRELEPGCVGSYDEGIEPIKTMETTLRIWRIRDLSAKFIRRQGDKAGLLYGSHLSESLTIHLKEEVDECLYLHTLHRTHETRTHKLWS